MNSTSHLAGAAITVEGRLIQRCAICGDKLIDSKNCFIAATTRENDTFSSWKPGMFVRVTTGNPQQWELLEDSGDGKLPDDSCIDLVE